MPRLNQIKNIMNYKLAIEKFNMSLESDAMVDAIAKHYGVSIQKVINELQCRIYTASNKSGEVTKVWLDFVDTNTMTKFNKSITF